MACSVQEVIIQCYMGKELLWNKSHEDYKNNQKRIESLIEIRDLIKYFTKKTLTSNAL